MKIFVHSSIFFSVLFLLNVHSLPAQSADTYQQSMGYRSKSNQNYWKNSKPFPGYWQQDVHYQVKADVDEKKDLIEGDLHLTYWNNSPDTLQFVYFHLYQNAFQPGSYYDNLQLSNKRKTRYGKYESEGLGTVIHSIHDQSAALQTSLDNTILKVWLHSPLAPGDSQFFAIKFTTYFDPGGNVRRRMKTFNSFGFKHYDGVHWYPRIAVYDRKFGWTTDQHLGREYYGDFGSFEVELTFANHFIVEATGILQNEEEVMPDSLRKKLDITNFANKRWNSPPSIIIPYDSSRLARKTWKFRANNVHDFAFTADPTYRIGEVNWGNIKCVALAQEPHASGWQTAALYTALIIEKGSYLFGWYEYPKMVVADARDGMEYPMLTLDGGFDPYYRDLLAHEVAHNWFFGMVGNNETYRAFMDEGFTQFAEVCIMELIEGKDMPGKYALGAYEERFRNHPTIRNAEIYNRYYQAVQQGDDAVIATHSDGFGGALRHGGGYAQVYFKTAVMLFNLQYVLGDLKFWKAMQNYFDQWKFAHPYPEDFRNSIIQFTGVDLNWFFDQWLETTKWVDYSFKSLKKKNQDNTYELTLERIGTMQQPIDLKVVTTEGEYEFHIPNTWYEKKTNATLLPRWIGWDKLNPIYKTEIKVPGKIKHVIIDESMRMPDLNRLNNSKKFPVDIRFDSQIMNAPRIDKYELFWRPDIWYNKFDGLKTGLHFNGHYMNRKHIFSLSAWYNTALGQSTKRYGLELPEEELGSHRMLSVNFKYKTAIDKISRKTYFSLQTGIIGGLQYFKTGFESDISQNTSLSIRFRSHLLARFSDLYYQLYPSVWINRLINNSIEIKLGHRYKYLHGKGELNIDLRSASLFAETDFNYLSLEAINYTRLGKLQLRTRLFSRYGTGSELPAESALFFAGASPEDFHENIFLRSRAFLPEDWTKIGTVTNHFQQGGGLNLRGYNGYMVAERGKDGNDYVVMYGPGGAGVNAELDIDGLVNFKPALLSAFSLDAYLFFDAGTIVYEQQNEKQYLSEIRADAGVGFALTLKRLWKFEKIKPLVVRFDFPVYLSHAPFLENDNFQFRWLLGLGRTF